MSKGVKLSSRDLYSRQRTRTILGLTLSFLVISGLLFGIFRGETARNRLLTQYQLEQALAQTITLFRGNLENLDLAEASGDLPLEVRAFALYDTNGAPLVRKGAAPLQLHIDEAQPREQLHPHPDIDNLLVYIRRFPSRSSNPTRFGGPPPPEHIQPPAALYLQARPELQLHGRVFSWRVFIIGELLLAALTLWIGRVQLSNQRYRRTLEQQRSLVTLGEASRTISHEIKNPLSVIRLRLKILQHHTPEASQQDLQVIREEVDRLNRLANKIRELLVAPEGSPQRIHLPLFFQQLQQHYPEAVSIDRVPDAYVRIDHDHLTSIMRNLINNSLQAESSLPVYIGVEQRRREIRITLRDSGSGIDARLLERLFSPFTTSKSDGSGLGLAISRTFARAAGGELSIAETSPTGTTIILVLPEAA